mmetsp:Transcript_49222/g.77839  ORF Transcript_49222/g.77839 Transcript_49222/m.77839 type:complete len:249 (+) Transcript_49222:90-836(+)
MQRREVNAITPTVIESLREEIAIHRKEYRRLVSPKRFPKSSLASRELPESSHFSGTAEYCHHPTEHCLVQRQDCLAQHSLLLPRTALRLHRNCPAPYFQRAGLAPESLCDAQMSAKADWLAVRLGLAGSQAMHQAQLRVTDPARFQLLVAWQRPWISSRHRTVCLKGPAASVHDGAFLCLDFQKVGFRFLPTCSQALTLNPILAASPLLRPCSSRQDQSSLYPGWRRTSHPMSSCSDLAMFLLQQVCP